MRHARRGTPATAPARCLARSSWWRGESGGAQRGGGPQCRACLKVRVQEFDRLQTMRQEVEKGRKRTVCREILHAAPTTADNCLCHRWPVRGLARNPDQDRHSPASRDQRKPPIRRSGARSAKRNRPGTRRVCHAGAEAVDCRMTEQPHVGRRQATIMLRNCCITIAFGIQGSPQSDARISSGGFFWRRYWLRDHDMLSGLLGRRIAMAPTSAISLTRSGATKEAFRAC